MHADRISVIAALTVALVVLVAGPARSGDVVVLEDTFRPVVSHFNGVADKIRFVSILSPT
jgi:hypothetical protein